MFSHTTDGDLLIFGLKSGDVIGLVSLVLAMSANVWLVWNYIEGAEITMFPPEQIELRCSRTELRSIRLENGEMSKKKKRFCQENSRLTIVASSIAYSNEGSSDYHALIKTERVTANFEFKDGQQKSLTAYWQWFTDISNVNINKTVATPSIVRAGEALAHETQFTSRFYSNTAPDMYLWRDFLIQVQNNNISKVSFSFVAEIIGDEGSGKDGLFEVDCTIVFDDRIADKFIKNGMRQFQQTFSCE